MSWLMWSVLDHNGFFQSMPPFTCVTTSCMAVEYGSPRSEIQEVYSARRGINEMDLPGLDHGVGHFRPCGMWTRVWRATMPDVRMKGHAMRRRLKMVTAGVLVLAVCVT